MDTKTIASRSVRGSFFTVGASVITVISGFIRSVLLARLLLPEHFGVVTLALFFLSLTTQVQRVGLNKAFIHRKDDSPENVGTFATLRVGLTLVAVFVSLLAAPLLSRFYPRQPLLGPLLIAFAFLEIIRAFNGVAESMFSKELYFKRLAAVNVASSILMTITAPLAAWAGAGIWALVVEQATGAVARLVLLWFYRRPFRLTFQFNRQLARWYFSFGKFIFANANLRLLLDQFDDFWTGTFLNAAALGFYGKAYEFARYPRRVLSGPLATVFFPTFAQLQADRLRLSKAFYRVSSLIVRAGFLAFGAFALVAPEFIRIFPGEKWLPMAVTLQLMLVYTLLDPLFAICGNLLSALGHPKLITQAQIIQAVVFVPAVVLLGGAYGINGVAVAADLMLVIGTSVLLWRARQFVDFSLRRMLLVPTIGLVLGVTAVLTLAPRFYLPNDWTSLLFKGTVIAIIYLGVLFAWERKELMRNAQLLRGYLLPRNKE